MIDATDHWPTDLERVLARLLADEPPVSIFLRGADPAWISWWCACETIAKLTYAQGRTQ